MGKLLQLVAFRSLSCAEMGVCAEKEEEHVKAKPITPREDESPKLSKTASQHDRPSKFMGRRSMSVVKINTLSESEIRNADDTEGRKAVEERSNKDLAVTLLKVSPEQQAKLKTWVSPERLEEVLEPWLQEEAQAVVDGKDGTNVE